ncbi:redoxin family protein, partial [Ligilactobacillus animalis]
EQQKNWCAAEGVAKLELLSDATAEFGKAMGLYVEEKGIDARSIWIVDTEGKVLYQELLTEQSDEPNYAKA